MSAESMGRRLAREPLVHFAVLAALVFGAHRWLAPATPTDADAFVLADAFVEGLRERHRRMHGELPDDASTDALVRQYLRDEALVREARRLGLDRDDPIVRRRLVQKMELWLEATVDVAEPTEAELEQALADGATYRAPARVAFEHVFFRSARQAAHADAESALASLAPGPAAPAELGDPFLLGRAFTPRTTEQVAGTFGPAFAEALRDAPLTAWSGPYESSYGWHLVRVTERATETVPPLDAVRERVREDLLRARRADAVRAHVERLVERHPARRVR